MAAVYPSGIKSFGADVVDAVDVVYAAHINDLRDEVEAVEGELGTGLKTSTWTGAFAQTGSWGNLALRLTNIERGIVTTSDVHTQYVKKAGDAMTGSLTMGGAVIGNLGAGSSATDAVNYGQVLLRSGANAATGNLNMGTSYKVTSMADGSATTDAATVGQVLLRSGTNAATGNLNMGTSYKITDLANGSAATDSLAYGQVLASGTTLIPGLFSGTNPTMDGTANVGSSSQPARSDHIHPSDTSRVAKAGDTMTGALTLSGDPTSALHAATKQYVDPSYCEGLRTSSTGSLSGSIGWVITYQSETDPGGVLNAAAGVATLPAGLWLVTVHAAVTFGSSSSALNLSIVVDSTSSNFVRVANPGTGSYTGLSVTEVVRASSPTSVWATLAVGGLGVDWYVNTAKFSAVRIGSL